ncbi:hypothetical protein MIN45_P0655 [Methylomarinovum tepidoasis]|uniref:Uncharacterized protein n=1 Tax=Methylomarinovum tepidoasis TaxID=2840183 RepID=A0AAU9C8W1_9GAMM|nr:hypothetical protein [Methylomarinovum sp. IN45]BCX88286.1 hypothetical protein MIN45_P0655 [Methylomarinovum sp. IN45]
MSLLRLYVTLFFCLLQVFAPLLHAYVGADASPTAVHLPGLEQVATDGQPAAPAEGVLVCAAKGVRPGAVVFSCEAGPVPGQCPLPDSPRIETSLPPWERTCRRIFYPPSPPSRASPTRVS